MKTICLYFQIHQPFRLKTYRFFDIGNDHQYYDTYQNRNIVRKVALNSYLPANQLLLELIGKYGKHFKISFSISGTALDQFEKYAPEVIESFQQLANTGNVEFLSETYAHSLASLKSKTEFTRQVKLHAQKIKNLLGQQPKVFRNTELIYTDAIGEVVQEMGYQAMMVEGAKHILGWKSPHYVYFNTLNPKLKILLRDFQLSDDIAFRFSDWGWSEWPLTTEKFIHWLNKIDESEKLINLFMSYETFGEHHSVDTGILEFLKALPETTKRDSAFEFATPGEAIERHQPKAALHVPNAISWTDAERDLTAWLGNELQDEAIAKLYQLKSVIDKVQDEAIQRDWMYLQTSDHFYYMCTKFFSDGETKNSFNPYDSPYDAFINYMNVLSDFMNRVKKATATPASKTRTKTQVLKEKEIMLK